MQPMADLLRLTLSRPFTFPSFCPSPASARLSLAPRGHTRLRLEHQELTLSFFSVNEHSISLHKRSYCVKVNASIAESETQKWWEKNSDPNMKDIHSTGEFIDALQEAGDRLVIVEFYGTWCGSCRALFPKLCRMAEEHPEILFLKVNFDENKPMCKRLNVRVLPYFHFYRGADGQLESFSCSLAKFQKIKDGIAVHNTARCSIGPPVGVGELDLLASPPTKKTESNSR